MTRKTEHAEQDPAEGTDDRPPLGPGSPRSVERPIRARNDEAPDNAHPSPSKRG
jgi:hypothetical protein